MEKNEINVTQGESKSDIIRRIKWHAGRKLIRDIKIIYEEIEIPVAEKKAKRQELTKKFIETCIFGFGLSQKEVEDVIESVIKSECWIQEIEEIDEISEGIEK